MLEHNQQEYLSVITIPVFIFSNNTDIHNMFIA